MSDRDSRPVAGRRDVLKAPDPLHPVPVFHPGPTRLEGTRALLGQADVVPLARYTVHPVRRVWAWLTRKRGG